MKFTLSKDVMFSLYKHRDILKNTTSEISLDYSSMFDKELNDYIENKIPSNWDNIFLILFFKYDKLTVDDILKIMKKFDLENYKFYKMTMSNKLYGWVKEGILIREARISDLGRREFLYYVNQDNIEYNANKRTKLIRNYINEEFNKVLENYCIINISNFIDYIISNHNPSENLKSNIRILINTNIRAVCKQDGIDISRVSRGIYEFKKKETPIVMGHILR